jgi:hypothetical protein
VSERSALWRGFVDFLGAAPSPLVVELNSAFGDGHFSSGFVTTRTRYCVPRTAAVPAAVRICVLPFALTKTSESARKHAPLGIAILGRRDQLNLCAAAQQQLRSVLNKTSVLTTIAVRTK